MPVRTALKKVLEQKGMYLRLRYSPLMLKAWRFFKPSFGAELQGQERLYNSVLTGERELIFDIGGNEGFTTELFTRLAEKVVVVEPSERNLRVLRSRFQNHTSVTIVSAAVSDHAGKQRFFDNNADHACSTLDEKWKSVQEKKTSDFSSYEVEITTLDELIKLYGRPDFIKIDVEGHEEAVIRGLTQTVPLLSFEAMLPLFREETIRTLEYLTSLGNAEFNFAVRHQLQRDKFISAEDLIQEIGQLDRVTIDIFCRSIPFEA